MESGVGAPGPWMLCEVWTLDVGGFVLDDVIDYSSDEYLESFSF